MGNVIATWVERVWAWFTTKTCDTCGETKPNKKFVPQHPFMAASTTMCWRCYMAVRRSAEANYLKSEKNSRIAEHLRNYEEKLEAFRKFKERQEATENYRVATDSTTKEFLDHEEEQLIKDNKLTARHGRRLGSF